jgi:hypothetical protein
MIKSDWSVSPRAAEIEAQMRQVLKDVSVPEAMLDQLPATGSHVLFPEGVVSFYDPTRYGELIEWLKENDLIAGRVDFPPPVLETPPPASPQVPGERPPASNLSASLAVGYEALRVDASSEVRSQPFIERTMNYRWTIHQEDKYLIIDGSAFYLEKNRGETTAREVPRFYDPSCAVSFVEDRVAVVDAFHATARPNLRRLRVESQLALIAIEPAQAQLPGSPGRAQLRLPEKVEQVQIGRATFERAPSRRIPQSRTLSTTSSPGDQAIRLFELKHVLSESLTATLQQLFPDKLLIGVSPGRNQLIVRGTASQLDEVSALLERLDQPAESDAKEVALQPTSKLQTGAQSQPGGANFIAPTSRAVWQQQYTAREQAAADLAQKCRTLATKADRSPQEAQQFDALRDQLRAVVSETFTARQELHRAELAELQQRMVRVQQTLEVRDRIQNQIIDRRVEDLLNPNLQWEAEPAGVSRGPIPAQNMPGSRPTTIQPPANVPQATPSSPTAAPVLREIPAETSGILRRATEFQAEFRKLQETIVDRLSQLQRTSASDEIGRLAHGQELASVRRELAALRAEFETQVRLLELNMSDARQALDSAVRKRDLAKSHHESGVVPIRELMDAERAMETAQHALERAEAIVDLYRKIELPSDGEDPKSADATAPTKAENGREKAATN